MTTMALSRLHHPVTTLGHGTRAGVWMQGCTIGCTGCVSQDTWVASARHQVRVDDVLAWLAARVSASDGVTISGGEPFQQPQALGELLTGIRELAAGRPLDVLCFSGYPLGVLRRRHPRLLDLLDVVIAGPYVRGRAAALPLRGSSNQTVTALTDLGRRRYPPAPPATDPAPHAVTDTATGPRAGTGTATGADARGAPADRRLQVAVQEGTLWYLGIPAPGDLERLDAMLRERGVDQGGVSWLS